MTFTEVGVSVGRAYRVVYCRTVGETFARVFGNAGGGAAVAVVDVARERDGTLDSIADVLAVGCAPGWKRLSGFDNNLEDEDGIHGYLVD